MKFIFLVAPVLLQGELRKGQDEQITVLLCKYKIDSLLHKVRQGTRTVHAKEQQSATHNESGKASATSVKML